MEILRNWTIDERTVRGINQRHKVATVTDIESVDSTATYGRSVGLLAVDKRGVNTLLMYGPFNPAPDDEQYKRRQVI